MLQLALEAAQEAAAIAMRYFQSGVRVETKPDRSPVTRADREAEAAIRARISAAQPAHRFYGEEFGAIASLEGPVWFIDPIDGTKNYIRGLPFFAVQLALYVDGVPEVAVSCAPVLNELVAARRGKGATLNGSPLRVSAVADLGAAFVAHGGIDVFENTGRLSGLRQIAAKAMSARGYGDFYGYHLLAAGKVDAMIEAEVSPWDVAALRLIVEEAGGRLTSITGETTALHKNTLATNGLLHDALLREFVRGAGNGRT